MSEKVELILKYGLALMKEICVSVTFDVVRAPTLIIFSAHADAFQDFANTDPLDWSQMLKNVVTLIRAVADKEQGMPHANPMWGMRSGDADFELFITPSYHGMHLVEIWVLDEPSGLHIPFAGKAKTQTLLAFAQELEDIRLGVEGMVEELEEKIEGERVAEAGIHTSKVNKGKKRKGKAK